MSESDISLNKVKFAIITVCHNIALANVSGRSSDTNALNMANILNNKLKAAKIDTILVSSGQNRSILDDNRFSTGQNTIKSNSVLWETLRKSFAEKKWNICDQDNYGSLILFDCHSFPSGSFGHTTDDNDVVILDYTPYQQLSTLFVNNLQNNNINARLLEGQIGSNSILDVFSLHPCKIPTILLEVNEKLNNMSLENIAAVLIGTLTNINKQSIPTEQNTLNKPNNKLAYKSLERNLGLNNHSES